jgi:hypothetical protein
MKIKRAAVAHLQSQTHVSTFLIAAHRLTDRKARQDLLEARDAMISRFIAIALLLLAGPAFAAGEPTGVWVLKASGTSIFRLEVQHEAAGWTAEWARPQTFDIDGDSFKLVSGPIVRRTSVSGRQDGDWVELRFADPEPNSLPDVFRIRLSGSDTAELHYNGARFGELTLVREEKGRMFGGWSPQRPYVYSRKLDYPTSAAMTALFDADQKARNGSGPIDWAVVGREDGERRKKTQALLEAGVLRSGDDFYHAAFIFQHGGGPDDFLKAHILATVSAARGNAAAIWISAATLDRYLQSIGKPQVAGTQFLTVDGKTTQEPYERSIMSDSLRNALRVPPLNEQEAQRQLIEDAQQPKGK